MAQFYFLSVLFNILAGLILVYGKDFTSYDSDDLSPANLDSSDADDDFSDITASVEEEAAASESKEANSAGDFAILNNKTFRLVVGILGVFVGIIKLLSPMDIPFVGDLIPALAGIVGGFALLVEYYVISSGDSGINDTLREIFIDSRKYLGIICVAAGVLHFILYNVVLL